ncbi:MAG: alginate export family protein [Rhizobacter sp.]|nr:alginate export family protein [Ferruginibacter sp.]
MRCSLEYFFYRSSYKKKVVISILISAWWTTIYAQSKYYSVVRYNDKDFSFLKNDTADKDFFNPIKYIKLNKEGNSYLTIGGEFREAYQLVKNENWGDVAPARDDKNGFFWHRFMLHASLHYKKSLRFFAQIKNANAFNRKGGARPTLDRDELSVHQAFVDLNVNSFINLEKHALVFRFGRQEYNYGWGKLISVREGPNNRQTFDGGTILYKTGKLHTDIFYAHNVSVANGVFDNKRINSQKIWGIYNIVSMPSFYKSAIDIYYIGSARDSLRLAQSTQNDRRATVGFRLSTQKTGLLYDWESIYQFGKFGKQNISAYSWVGMLGYEWGKSKYRPGITFHTGFTSGEKNFTDNKIQTFNPLYPRPPFPLGLPLGPSNVNATKFEVYFKPAPKFKTSVGFYEIWRNSSMDGTYTPSVMPLRTHSSQNISNKALASLYYIEGEYHTRHLTINMEAVISPAKGFTQKTGAGKTIYYLLIQAGYKF